jgi:hypothetical protein
MNYQVAFEEPGFQAGSHRHAGYDPTAARQKRSEAASAFRQRVQPDVARLAGQGLPLRAIAAEMNRLGLTSSRGGRRHPAGIRRMLLTDRLAALIADRRDPSRVVHPLADILRARILAIACGYEDADDLDHLRRDPGFKLACGRLPDSGRDLCSQPTMSR